MKPTVRRGDLFMAFLDGKGSEQGGKRPVLVVQNDVGNNCSQTTMVVPLTSRNKKVMPTHVDITTEGTGLSADSTALVEQMRVLDKSRISEKIGSVSEEIMALVQKAIFVECF